jgi:hypothetical protein
MKLKLHYRIFLALMLFLTVMPTLAQEKKTFKTVREYLNYAEKNFGIAPEEIYFVAESNTTVPPKKVSSLMFFQDGQMAVFEDVVKVMQSSTSTHATMQRVTPAAVRKTMFKDPLANTEFTNMLTGEIYKPAKGEMVAVILMGQELDDASLEYLKGREGLSKTKGIKTLVVTVDENDITELVKRKNSE